MKITTDDLQKWSCFENDVFPVKVFIFIGKRKEMFDTAVAGMRMCFKDANAIPEAEVLAEQLKESFDADRSGISGECLSVETEDGARAWFVRMDDFSGSVDSTVMLSHECLHAATSILRYLGVNEDKPFETLCYLHEAIYKRFLVFSFGRIGMLKDKQ